MPAPVQDFTTGARPDDGLRLRAEDHGALAARADRDRRRALAEELLRAYLKQILVDGFFHADPHPGNVFLTDDGRVALIDLGMVGLDLVRSCRRTC